jgi:hypothetical protein
MIGSKLLGQIVLMATNLERRRRYTQFVYGRRGVGKAATALTQKDVKARVEDSFLYEIPPAPQCHDEYSDVDQVESFRRLLELIQFSANCIHSEESIVRNEVIPGTIAQSVLPVLSRD